MDAEHIVGYTTYVELLPDEVTESAEELYDTPMCGEVSRTEAIDRALAGNDVAIIGSGDPNVYALAGLALGSSNRRVRRRAWSTSRSSLAFPPPSPAVHASVHRS